MDADFFFRSDMSDLIRPKWMGSGNLLRINLLIRLSKAYNRLLLQKKMGQEKEFSITRLDCNKSCLAYIFSNCFTFLLYDLKPEVT